MPISPLSDFTIRAIGSSLVLHDATSVVKELIDNAIDANASIIAIELSVNTLDVIQVKDDGSGIGVDDRQLVCKRGCTSKIRTIEDLERLGGSSLGFRGEALASIAALSDSVTVTTRIDGEVVGTLLKYGVSGGLLSSASASHPIGTTIRVHDFLKSIPVRKQTAVKSATKTILAIKKLLFAYAFARPSVRLSFKILKGKKDKGNWVYAPTNGSKSLLAAALRIVGPEIATQCELRAGPSSADKAGASLDSGFRLNALLYAINDEAAKSSGGGQFISIDGRPVNSARGTMREIVKLYKSYYWNAFQNQHGSRGPADPFLCLYIKCPVGSYDVNVEPAKDEVMFMDPAEITSLAEKLFVDFYGSLIPTAEPHGVECNIEVNLTAPVTRFDLLLARKLPESKAEKSLIQSQLEDDCPSSKDNPSGRPSSVLGITPAETVEPHTASKESQEMRNAPEHATDVLGLQGDRTHFNMYSLDDDDFPEDMVASPSLDISDEHPEDDSIESPKITNPWSLAKLHATIQPRSGPLSNHAPSARLSQSLTPISKSFQSSSPERALASNTHRVPLDRYVLLPSPGISTRSPAGYQNPGPPLRRRLPRDQMDGEEETVLAQNSNSTSSTPRQGSRLDSWIKSSQARMQLPSFQRTPDADSKSHNLDKLPSTYFEAASGSVDAPAIAPQLPQLDRSPRPFKSPVKNQAASGSPLEISPAIGLQSLSPTSPGESSPFDATQTAASPANHHVVAGNEKPGCEVPLHHSPQFVKVSQSTNPELAQILEFEHRKKAVMKQQRREQRLLGNGSVNPGKLARIELEAEGTSLAPKARSANMASFHGLYPREDDRTSKTSFKTRFGPPSVDEDDESEYSEINQHRSQHLAATRSLKPTRPGQEQQLSRPTMVARTEATTLSSENLPAIPALQSNDPRALLMRLQRSGNLTLPKTGLVRPTLGIHRTKSSSRLPLETIPPDVSTHRLIFACDAFATPSAASSTQAAAACQTLRLCDPYPGSGSNEYVRWDAVGPHVRDWQTTLERLVAALYRTGSGEREPCDIALVRAGGRMRKPWRGSDADRDVDGIFMNE